MEFSIATNLRILKAEISAAAVKAGRKPDDVRLIAVTKKVGLDEIRALLSLGQRDIGENKVQDAVAKYEEVGDGAVWHFIGHLQKNKVKQAVAVADYIHSIDSLKLMSEVSRRAAAAGKRQNVLIQANLIDSDRFGFEESRLAEAVEMSLGLDGIEAIGLMAMAPFTQDENELRRVFSRLRALRERLSEQYELRSFTELSMGMSNDYLIAVEEGATMVRIGSAIFRRESI